MIPRYQVVAVQREADARLTLVVQGLSRGVALRCTQSLPYARADFQLLPDDEMLLGCARFTARFTARYTEAALAARPPADRAKREAGRETSRESGREIGREIGRDVGRPLHRRLLLAAAAAEEAHWWPYEHANLSLSMHQVSHSALHGALHGALHSALHGIANLSLSMHQSLSLPDFAAGEAARRGEGAAIREALEATMAPAAMAPADGNADANADANADGGTDGDTDGEAAVGGEGGELRGGEVYRETSGAALVSE